MNSGEILDLLHAQPAAWLDGSGPAGETVLFTQARLSRNVAGFHFPIQAGTGELATILAEMETWLTQSPFAAGWHFLDLEDLADWQRKLLLEKHLVTARSIREPLHCGLLASPGGSLTGLVNEEDHLRLTATCPGFDPAAATAAVAGFETELEKEFGFAYQEDLGYLTSWPGSLGTGLHLATVLHLPGLVLADEIDKIINAMQQLRFTMRGLYGRGGTVRGCLFLITSQVTLGCDEEEITNDFSYHVGKVLLHESSARQQLHARDRLWLEDLVHRSFAVLRSARLITSQETFDRLSHLRLGVGLGILPELGPGLLNRLVLGQQGAHLQHAAGESLTGNDRARVRASFLRNELARAIGG